MRAIINVLSLQVYLSLYPLAKMVGLLDCECVYWFRKPDRTILGYIRPKLVLSGRTVVIKFTYVLYLLLTPISNFV